VGTKLVIVEREAFQSGRLWWFQLALLVALYWGLLECDEGAGVGSLGGVRRKALSMGLPDDEV